MAAVIGNDVLDIGSRKNRRQRGSFAPQVTMGMPSQFDLPNVPDVSRVTVTSYVKDSSLIVSMHKYTLHCL
jgi:hypothetical protein